MPLGPFSQRDGIGAGTRAPDISSSSSSVNSNLSNITEIMSKESSTIKGTLLAYSMKHSIKNELGPDFADYVIVDFIEKYDTPEEAHAAYEELLADDNGTLYSATVCSVVKSTDYSPEQ